MEALVRPSSQVWNGKRVLITGHSGFKGAWLWSLLHELGADPHGLALAPAEGPNLASLSGIWDAPQSYEVDIRDASALSKALAEIGPDVIVHMAAQSLVRHSYLDPSATWATNVMGTVNLLEASRQSGHVQAVIVVTTDKCYENREWVWPYRETDRLGGHDPYSSSKAAAELVAACWRSSFKGIMPPLSTVRAGNVIGGGDWAVDRLIPDCARAFIGREKVLVRNPLSIRPWQHVLEPLVGYLLLAEAMIQSPDVSGAWNFGPSDLATESVGLVVDLFARKWGSSLTWAHDKDQAPHEARTLRIDSSKARNKLGWKPLLSLDEAIGWSATWYRRWADGEDPAMLCREQIKQYLSLSRV